MSATDISTSTSTSTTKRTEFVSSAAAPAAEGHALSKEIVDSIVEALNGLTFGSIEIKVHNSRIVQIDRHERIRLGPAGASGTT
ncbi:MAG: YezD family protein [Verrucomicrobiales bacterium]|nr:YezD family protein [Verrucomicrobiales bacterium]